MDEKEFSLTPEEQTAEKEALAEAKAEEVRTKVVADLGLADDETNKPVIDKIVERELANKKKLSEAIGQKIKWRDAAKTAKTAKPAQQQKPEGTQTLDADAIRKQTEDTVTQRLEQRDLDEMEYPDEIKAEIKSIAKVKGISVRQAEKDGYIQHLITQAKVAGKIVEATVSRSPKGTPSAPQGKMPQFDMSTAEGRKAYDDYKKDRDAKK